MMLPIDRRAAKHSIGKAGRASERKIAKSLGGRVRPASGAMEGAKGDITVGELLIEAKSTTTATMSLKHAWLGKIAMEARNEGKEPALTVTFVNSVGNPVIDGEWALVPLHVFKERML